MFEQKTLADSEIHKKLAVDLFNLTWDLIEKKDRNVEEDEMMINAAHASRFHWGIVGTPLQFARGEWQISRVYALLGRPEPALFHAMKSLDLCKHHNLSYFDVGFAYEALARAYAVEGNTQQRDKHVELALQFAEQVGEGHDKTWLVKNIQTVASLTLPLWETD